MVVGVEEGVLFDVGDVLLEPILSDHDLAGVVGNHVCQLLKK